MKMDNKFFQFVKTYWDDITAFFDALVAFVKALFGTQEEETTPEA